MEHIKLFEEFIDEQFVNMNKSFPEIYEEVESKRCVEIYKMENGFYWLRDCLTGELIDGDRRLYVVKDMAKRWNFKIVK